MGVRFLHLADLHLGSQHPQLGDIAESRAREILETFRRAVTFALDPAHRIDALLVAGNLFDRHRPDPETWAFVRGLLGRLLAAKKPVVLIPGTRDGFAYRDSVYRTERWLGADLITTPRPAEPLSLDLAGHRVFVYGVAAVPGHSPESFPGFTRTPADGLHIGILNAALPDHPEWEVRPHDQVITPEVIEASGLDYLALGGYHGYTPLRFGSAVAAYPGTLEGRRFEPGDLGPKSLLVVDIDPETRVVGFERHPASEHYLEDWTVDLGAERITDPEGLTAALLARAGSDVIAQVTLVGPLEFLCDLNQVAGQAAPRFHHLALVDRTDLLGSSLLRRLEGENTIRGFFVRRLLKRIAALAARASTATAEAPVHRDLRVARLALRLGLEQFLDEEPAPELARSAVPESAPRPKPRSADTPPPLPAAAAAAAALAGRNGGQDGGTAGRARVLLRADRDGRNEAANDTGGEIA